MQTEIIKQIPRSGDIQIAENAGGTVFEFVPESMMVGVYKDLAEEVLKRSNDE